jgi:alkylation response protein AidB-like acyl-CoA dehydrogenase
MSELSEERFRAQVVDLLSQPDVREELATLGPGTGSEEAHPRQLYGRLGAHGWLAPHWPVRYGGLGLTWAEAAIVAEELVLHGAPDTAIVNGIYNVGECLLRAGTPAQRQRYLPGLASGTLVATVLLSEANAGSDLAALETVARPGDGTWTLDGLKTWSAKSHVAAVALCAARTAPGFAGITLFLVPLDAPGVHVRALDTVNVEALHEVELVGVTLTEEHLVGQPGDGWPLLGEVLTLERASLSYQARARRWLDTLDRHIHATPGAPTPVVLERLAALSTRVDAGHELAWRAVRRLTTGGTVAATADAAMAKWYNTEIANEVLDLAFDVGADGAPFEAAQREAVGLTLAAGTSEMMLTIVQSELGRLFAED